MPLRHDAMTVRSVTAVLRWLIIIVGVASDLLLVQSKAATTKKAP